MPIDAIKGKVFLSEKVNGFRTKLHELVSNYEYSTLILIFGCQRSGTTIIQKLIRQAPCVRSYGEGELPYFWQQGSAKLRLLELDEIKRLLSEERNKYVLLKPLYDSHRIEDIMLELPASKAIWVYRNHYDVVESHIEYYGENNAFKYLEMMQTSRPNWINEKLNRSIMEGLSFDPTSMSDCYALFWYLRNLQYRQCQNISLKLFSYDDFVEKKEPIIKDLCQYLGLEYSKYYSSIVHANSFQKNFNYNLSESLDKACCELYNEMKQST